MQGLPLSCYTLFSEGSRVGARDDCREAFHFEKTLMTIFLPVTYFKFTVTPAANINKREAPEKSRAVHIEKTTAYEKKIQKGLRFKVNVPITTQRKDGNAGKKAAV